jgi:hypothetical protein
MTTKDERLAFVAELRFERAVFDHADKLREPWTSKAPRCQLSRAYELLHPGDLRRAIVQWCLAFACEYHPGTVSNPITAQHLPELYREGKIEFPELPYLRPYLHLLVLAALQHGLLAAWALERDTVARGKRHQVDADRWNILQPDFEHEVASVDGEQQLFGIEVEVAQATDARPIRRKVSQSDLTRWYRETWIPACRVEGRIPSRDDDFAAAKAHFDGGDFSRDWLRRLRPRDWSLPGIRAAPKLAD